jgi:hypothetical protein
MMDHGVGRTNSSFVLLTDSIAVKYLIYCIWRTERKPGRPSEAPVITPDQGGVPRETLTQAQA